MHRAADSIRTARWGRPYAPTAQPLAQRQPASPAPAPAAPALLSPPPRRPPAAPAGWPPAPARPAPRRAPPSAPAPALRAPRPRRGTVRWPPAAAGPAQPAPFPAGAAWPLGPPVWGGAAGHRRGGQAPAQREVGCQVAGRTRNDVAPGAGSKGPRQPARAGLTRAFCSASRCSCSSSCSRSIVRRLVWLVSSCPASALPRRVCAWGAGEGRARRRCRRAAPSLLPRAGLQTAADTQKRPNRPPTPPPAEQGALLGQLPLQPVRLAPGLLPLPPRRRQLLLQLRHLPAKAQQAQQVQRG